MRNFRTGATRDSDHDKYDYEGFLSPHAIERFARYMHKHRIQADGNMRDSDNWQKGIPQGSYMKSLFRHFMEIWKLHRRMMNGQVATREEWEDALCAALFNIQGLLHESAKRPIAPYLTPPFQGDAPSSPVTEDRDMHFKHREYGYCSEHGFGDLSQCCGGHHSSAKVNLAEHHPKEGAHGKDSD